MFDFSHTLEGFVRLAVLMLPVLGVVLLFIGAHLVGGALKRRGR